VSHVDSDKAEKHLARRLAPITPYIAVTSRRVGKSLAARHALFEPASKPGAISITAANLIKLLTILLCSNDLILIDDGGII
jgi:hypothetical protein